MTNLANQIEALSAAATPGDLSTAERHLESEYVECPMCSGVGEVEAADYCNFDGVALGVQFYGIGSEFGAHEALWRAFNDNRPQIIAALRAAAEAEALHAALLAVVAATRAYLPPDGIDAKECINLILAATDNPAINPIIAAKMGEV